MKNTFTKISFIILIVLIITSCNTTKHVPKSKRLLTKNEIVVDGATINDENVFNQLYQKANSSILGYRLRLNLFNLAKQNTDSIYKSKFIKNPEKYYNKAKWLSRKQVNRLGHSFWYEGIHSFLKRTGEPPTILDTISTKKTLKRLKAYYSNKGFFDVKAQFYADSSQTKRVKIKYTVDRGIGFIVDSLKAIIQTPVLDSIYQTKKTASFLKNGKQYTTEDLDNERNRITSDFRENGAFYFQQNYINYSLDTLNTNKKANIQLIVKNQNIRVNDSSKTQPFKIYMINKVNIYTDYSSKIKFKVKDSVAYKNFNLLSAGKLKYKPKAITDAIFIAPGHLYSDKNNILSTKYLSNLKIFNYPIIQYKIDPNDENGLIANVLLTPRPKFTYNASADFSHSDIQDFGISGTTSVGIRNVFNGAETFEIGFRGNVGASKDLANPNNNFFNISEIGINAKLSFPRIFFPLNTHKVIPKTMIPSTTFSVGFAKQTNIGLDKQNLTSTLTYNWTPNKNCTARYDLFNIQFVKNVNTANYFNIYQSSYRNLNSLAQYYSNDLNYFDAENNLIVDSGTNGFINDALNNSNLAFPITPEDFKIISSIKERENRLTENNLIFASSYSYSKTTKTELADDSYYGFKAKIESAGNFLSLIAKASKQLDTQSGANTFFDVEYSQYIKTEFEYIKHWDLNRKKVVAIRSFFGIAIPYGNSKSIPFSRSYFSGGTNDLRAWQPYSLGPGSSGGINDFNEANMKLGLNAELRFNISGPWNGVLFTDMGNIWNVLDNVDDEKYKFNGIKSLETIAIGTGFGIRYDFGLFVLRGELGFKTYNPAREENQKWFKEINLNKSVVNIGINYPF